LKTYDLSVPEQAAAYQVSAAMQMVLFGQAYLSADGTRVTVYEAGEIIIRPRPGAGGELDYILPGESCP